MDDISRSVERECGEAAEVDGFSVPDAEEENKEAQVDCERCF
jgi:hypothetical protein